MASAWGNSWGLFWGNSWGDVGAAEAPAAVTIANGPPRVSRATPYYYKTLSELREEEKARLKRLEKEAKRKLREAIKRGESDPGPLFEIAARPLGKQTFLPDLFVDELLRRIVAEAMARYLQVQAAEEDDLEVILLTAA